jgi:hypothetical protein
MFTLELVDQRYHLFQLHQGYHAFDCIQSQPAMSVTFYLLRGQYYQLQTFCSNLWASIVS